MLGVDHGAHVDALVERVAEAEAVHPVLQLGVEAVGDAFLHDEARAGAADLALVEPDRVDQAFDRAIEIGIVEDDVGRLAAKFERQRLAGAGRGFADLAADLGRAGEGDLVDARVGDQRRAGLAVAGDDVEQAPWQAGLAAEVGEQEGGERGPFGGFQDHGIAGGQRGGDLPGQHQEWEVPGDHRAADSVGGHAGEFGLHQLGEAGVVVEMARDQRHVDVAAFADRLAVVHRL